MAKGSGMIHPNMATMLGVCILTVLLNFLREAYFFLLFFLFFHFFILVCVFQVITTDALVTSDVWRKMVQIAVNRSFNQITVWNIIALFQFIL